MSRRDFLSSIRFQQNKDVFYAGILGLILAAIHQCIRLFIPEFSVLYDGPERATWISITIVCEFLLHLLFFGGLIAVTGRSIPALNNPRYSKEGTESIFDYSEPEEPVNWSRILTAWGFAPIYILGWLFAYGYL